MSCPSKKLNSGHDMPMVGLGTWQAAPGEVGAAVRTALEAGYRHIDCAACYGNEKEIGDVLAEMLGDGEGQIPRSEVFITSKLWNSEHAPAHVQPALDQTLADLQLAYLDLYLVHWPQCFEKVEGTNRGFPKNEDGSMRYDMSTSSAQTWEAMEACVAAGKTRSIGLSNFNSEQISAICATAQVQPAVLQVEVHPYFAQKALLAFCESKGIAVTAYSPLASGATGKEGHTIPVHPVLRAIGERNGGRSAAQVAVAWQLQRGVIVIPKSVTAARVQQNFDVFFDMSADDVAAVDALDENCRMGWGGPQVERNGQMRPRDEAHPLYPFKADDSSFF